MLTHKTLEYIDYLNLVSALEYVLQELKEKTMPSQFPSDAYAYADEIFQKHKAALEVFQTENVER